MSLITNIPGTASFIITLIDQAYLSIIAAIWYYVVYYGLAPKYAFPVGIGSNNSFASFYGFLMNSVYVTIAGLLILGGAFAIVASNSLGRIQFPSSFIYRAVFSVTLSFFSLQISFLVMKLFLALFLKVWNYGDMNWYSLFSVSGSVAQIKTSFAQSPFLKVIEFLVLSVLFTGTGALLAVLEIRQAILIFLVLTLPLFSLFFIMRGLDSVAIKFWKLFVEVNALPFFIVIILFNVHIFPNDFPLQAGFITLAATSPYLLVTASSALTSRASTILSPGDITGRAVQNPAQTAHNLLKGQMGGAGFNRTRIDAAAGSGSRGKPISDIAQLRDFEFRKFGGGGNEE